VLKAAKEKAARGQARVGTSKLAKALGVGGEMSAVTFKEMIAVELVELGRALGANLTCSRRSVAGAIRSPTKPSSIACGSGTT